MGSRGTEGNLYFFVWQALGNLQNKVNGRRSFIEGNGQRKRGIPVKLYNGMQPIGEKWVSESESSLDTQIYEDTIDILIHEYIEIYVSVKTKTDI